MSHIRLTQRRKMLLAAWQTSELVVAEAMLPLFAKQHRVLEQELRRANLRKRIGKVALPVDFSEWSNAPSDYRVHEFVKAGVSHDDWVNWRNAVVTAIILALMAQVQPISDVENLVWTSRGYELLTFNAKDLVEEYQRRVGRHLEDTIDNMLEDVEYIIRDWYISGAPFSELMRRLDSLFSMAHATKIAETEVGNLVSQVVFQAMMSHGWSEWYWDALGPNPCSKPLTIKGVVHDGCLGLNGQLFKKGDPMPPNASHPGCHCLPTPKIPGE